MDGLTQTRNDIYQAAGFNAGLMWRKSVANLILTIGCVGLAGWSSYVSYKAREDVRTIALVFDQNLSLLAKADVGKPFVPTDDFYTSFATEFILDFRRRPRTRDDYKRQLEVKVKPRLATADLINALTRVADYQTAVMGAVNVEVSRLSVLPDGDRLEPNVLRVKANWTETSGVTGRSREWDALLTIRYVRQPIAEFGAPGYGMRLVNYQSTQIEQ